ncbi:TolB-like translocation protein [Flavobacterium flavipallidum]|uniref:Oligogalacturonide lyase n=1 Tax=Flavobacterium flavipallidum TaxID=3139140 RepID=A0ABU9HN94_9FLAO
MKQFTIISILSSFLFLMPNANAQIGKRFPSEKKVVKDPVTGTMLTFLTSKPMGDSKIYQTHNQWTSDGEWLIFRSNRAKGEAMAVHEKTGEMVQVTEGGYTGMLNVARNCMKLFFMRKPLDSIVKKKDNNLKNRPTSMQVVEVDLAKLFADSKKGKLKKANYYQRVCGSTKPEMGAGGDLALDGDENWAYFRVGKEEAARHLPADTKLEKNYGPRNMGAGPAGIAAMNVHTGEIKYVISVPFQIGHIQTNPWMPGEIVFCWETGGKSPQRTWRVMSDGTGLRPLYPESEYEWVTHEAVISKDEVAMAIMGHRKIQVADTTGTAVGGANPGQEAAWGASGTREKPTGLAIVNLRTREMRIEGQTDKGSGLWHVSGSPDGRWAVGDDFSRSVYLIDRHTHEMLLLSTGHKTTAADHPHPTMSPDGTKIQIQSAMLSEDNKSMNICIIPVPEEWLKRKY